MNLGISAEQAGDTCRPQKLEHDNQLRAKVNLLLQSSGYRELSRISCDVTDGIVALFGTLPSYHLKQQAQTIVINLDTVEGVENLLDVVRK